MWLRNAAVHRHDRAEREAIDVVDVSRGQRLARVHDLVACRENRDARSGVHLDVGASDGGECADAAGREDVAGARHQVADGDVRGAAADVLPGSGGRLNQDITIVRRGLFNHHHGVGAEGSGAPVAISAQAPAATVTPDTSPV